jgi:hypothetical protein
VRDRKAVAANASVAGMPVDQNESKEDDRPMRPLRRQPVQRSVPGNVESPFAEVGWTSDSCRIGARPI